MSEYSIKFCPSCGARAESGDLFCAKCGKPLRRDAASTPNTRQTPPRSHPAPGEKTAPPRQKGNVVSRLFLLIVVALLVWALLPNGGLGAKYYTDFESAGKHVLPQLLKRQEIVTVSYRTDNYNRILGSTKLCENIMREALRYNGKAAEGERLALSCKMVEVEEHSQKQKDGTYKLNLKIRMKYFLDKQQEKALADEADRILSRLHLDGKSDYEKVRAIYNYICSNVVYDDYHVNDESYLPQYTAYAAAVDHTAVCSGVADLFYYLANSAGVETHIKTNSNHAWNFVKLDGKYYYLDATWDLGVDEPQYRFFLKGTDDFNHWGGVLISLYGSTNLLTNSDEGYNFSRTAYVP